MTFRSNKNPMFRSAFGEAIFDQKYSHGPDCETWAALARTMVDDICSGLLRPWECQFLVELITDMKFIPGGRYLAYAGRPNKFVNNCYLLRAEEDTREDWAALSWRAESCLMTGGGIGVDYSRYREKGLPLSRTGGISSGPIPKMMMTNEIGRHVMQGGSRRSAIYASLNWRHADIPDFLVVKNWDTMKVAGTAKTLADVKREDFNFPAPLDMTNISVNYDDAWRDGNRMNPVFVENVRQALRTAEPGFSFNFGHQQDETLRNACTEITSADDSDVCNLGSINLSRIETLHEFNQIIWLATAFLMCGTVRADLPYPKVRQVREKNRRLGLGLMGIHEWLLSRGHKYEMNDELRQWLEVYKGTSRKAADTVAYELSVSKPVAVRAIAPTGSIGILAGTTTGIEPVFAVAYKRRYLREGTRWVYQYVVDSAAKEILDRYALHPDDIETALGLASDYERRIRFQADLQDYVDHAISSTINLPAWGSSGNNEDGVLDFARCLATYAPRLRGFTCYPDGARGGQPLTPVAYSDAINRLGEVFEERAYDETLRETVEAASDVCDLTGRGGTCGS